MNTEDTNNDDARAIRRTNPARDGLERTGLYHSFRLPDGEVLQGAMDLEFQEERLASFDLPGDLTGHDFLDIGPWDGYYSFELERRGARVTAIDYVDLDTFRELRQFFGRQVCYLQLDIYELSPAIHGTFSFVLCFGVLYHLKYPLIALEKVCAVTTDLCLIDTLVVDGKSWQQGIHPPLPYIEFYETDELSGQLDNWCGPTVGAVEALVRAAGFAEAEIRHVTDTSVRVAAHRKWRNLPSDELPALELLGINSHRHPGRSFLTAKEEYLTLWCKWDEPSAPPLHIVFPEVDGYGVAPMSCVLTPEGLQVGFRVPPGLSIGEHSARLKIGLHGWSSKASFYIDLSDIITPVSIVSGQDSSTWETNTVLWANGGWLTLWVDGLTAEADAGNTVVWIADVPHAPDAVRHDLGQINVRLRPVISGGEHPVWVIHRGSKSNVVEIQVVGVPPTVKGLERLRGKVEER